MKPIISSQIRIRHPELFRVGADSIVDDFCYFSTQVTIGRCSHVANGCSVGGGKTHKFTMGDFCSLSAGVRIWCVSDDFVNDVVAILPKGLEGLKKNLIAGDVSLGNGAAIGANSVVMPGNQIPEGTVIGALSFVPAGYKFKPWHVYAGIPIRPVRARNRKSVEAQIKQIREYFSRKAGK